MSTTIKPVVYTTNETKNFTINLADDIKKTIGKDADLLLDHPAIYIHIWQSKTDELSGKWSVYVGETNDIVSRTNQHWFTATKKGTWQNHMLTDVDSNGKTVVPVVYYFGHKLFHKSLTLDIENRLIDYFLALPTTNTHNGRTNPQGAYSGDDNLDDIFSMIWKILRKDNPNLFLSENYIQKSAIYKASPNHRLTNDQRSAHDLIINSAADAILSEKSGQLIFVEGDAGTGKTVLTSTTFYDIIDDDFFKKSNLKCYLLINHAEQRLVYENMTRKLGYSDDVIQSPTNFLKKHSVPSTIPGKLMSDTNNMADIVFVDEAHLLWNTYTQAFDSHFETQFQLAEIMKRSRVTVIMYDESQVLHFRQVCSHDYMDSMRSLAKTQGADPKNGKSNYIILNNQLRMNCDGNTLKWIDDITKKLVIGKLSLNKKKQDTKGYEILVFDDPASMHAAIMGKASQEETQLSRIVSTLDWKYSDTQAPMPPKHYQDITIGKWSIPWNEEIFWRDLYSKLNNRQKKKYKSMDWAEKDYSIKEAGNTFTIQGFDLAFVGVILGPSVKYDEDNKCIYFDESCRTQNYMIGKRKMPDGSIESVATLISRNEMRVLLTRGAKGLYIYACDDKLRKALQNNVC